MYKPSFYKLLLLLFLLAFPANSFAQGAERFLEGWLPLGISKSVILESININKLDATQTTNMAGLDITVLEVHLSDRGYYYFIDQESERCYLVVKEYLLIELPDRIKSFETWETSKDQELTWRNSSFPLFTIIANLEIYEDTFAIKYSSE